MRRCVLMLTHTDVPFDNRILKEMDALASASHQWIVRSIGVKLDEGNEPASPPRGTEVVTLRLRSRSWTWLPKPVRNGCTMLELTWKLVRLGNAWSPDVVHAHDTMVLPAAAIIAWCRKAYLVYDAHELESNKNGTTPVMAWATLVIERLVWSSVDLFVTVSPSIQNWYLRTFGAKPAVVVLNAPLSAPHPVADRTDTLRTRFGIPAEATLCVYVGYLGVGRSLEALIQVFSDPERSSHLVIVGYGPLWDLCSCAAASSSHLHLHEAVPHDHLVSLIQEADVGVCLIENVSLSDYYCLPNKLFEYLAAGLAVLASDFPEMRRIVEQHQCGIVVGEGANAMRLAIRQLEAKQLDRAAGIPNDLAWTTQAEALTTAYLALAR